MRFEGNVVQSLTRRVRRWGGKDEEPFPSDPIQLDLCSRRVPLCGALGAVAQIRRLGECPGIRRSFNVSEVNV